MKILQESNKNFALFEKHFHKLMQSKSPLEDLLIRHEKHSKRIYHQNESGMLSQLLIQRYRFSYSQISREIL